MPGTILLDDLRDSIGQQLGDYASGLTQAATAAVQPIAAAIPTPQTPDPNAILQELQQHAAAAAQAAQEQAQPALQVLGGAQQAAGGAVTQLGQTKDQIEQQLQQHAQTVADTSQQLGDHVNNIISGTVQGGQQALQSLATPPPTLGAVNDRGGISTDQGTPTLGGTTGAVSANAPGTAPTNAPAPDRSMSYQDYARAAAVRAGIDPNIFVAQIQQESGFTPAARSGAGAIGIAQFMPATAAGMNLDPTDPYASLDAAAQLDAQNLKKYNGDYSKTLAAYNAGGGAVDQYGGVPPYKETQTYVSTILGNARQSPSAPTPPQQTTAQARASDLGYTDISQFGDKQLSNDEAYAACGPAAAVRFAERFGRNPTLREATDLAKQVGWTASGGMAGIQSEQQLLKNMGVDTHVVAPDWDAIAKEAQTGNPVTISTPGHYYFADGYNPETGAFHVGQSGLDLRQGSEWMTPSQMESLMGKAQGALFADNPNVPAKGAAPVALGGTTGAQNAPITLGGPAPARAPLYADTNQPATPIQSAADVVGGAASALGTAAQQALAQAQEINRIQPGTEALKAATPVRGVAQQGSAAVNQVAQDVQNAAQGVLGAAQDVNRLTPGASAVQAAAPVLGAAASDVGAGARAAADTAGQTLGGSADQVRQQVQDTIDSLPSNATVAQARSAIGDTLDQLGPRALEVAGNLPLPMGGTVADLQAPLRGAQVGLQTIEEQRQAQLNRPDPVQQFQDNVDAARRGDWGAFAQGTLALAQRPFEPIMGGPEADISQAVSAALTAGGIDANAARVLGQVANVIGPMLLERAIPEVVSAATRGADAAVNAGLEAIDRLAPPEVALATTRRAGESADDYLARLAGEAPKAAPPEVTPPVNPYDLPRTAPEPNAAPLSQDQVLSHLEGLDEQHAQNDARIAELQNRLSAGGGRGDYSGTVVRPPWAVGWTNQGLEDLARRNNLNPYEANWWERGNFLPGTGEMREDVGQSGIAGGPRYSGTKLTQQSPTQMRAELARLQADQTQLNAAHDSIWEHAGQGGDVYAPATPEGLPFEGGLDAGAAQAARGPAPENAPPTGGSGEAGPGVSGASAAAPAERAAPAEVAGFRASEPPVAVPLPPEPVEGLPGVTRRTVRGAEPPEVVTAQAADAARIPPRAAVDPVAAHAVYPDNSAMPLNAAVGHQATTVTGGGGGGAPGTPLERLNAMYEQKPGGPSVLQRIADGRTAIVRALTDRGVDISQAQQRYAEQLGRPLNADELMYEYSRLQPGPAAQARIEQDLAPTIRSVGNDYQALRNYVTARSNIQVADALGNEARAFSGDLTKADSQMAINQIQAELGPDRFAKVQQAADQVSKYGQDLRQRLVDSGVLSDAQANSMLAKYPDWVKTRILKYMDEQTGGGGQGQGQRIGLSSRDVRAYTQAGTTAAREDPIASMVSYTYQVERMAQKNDTFNALVTLDKASPNPELRPVSSTYSPTSAQSTVQGFINGNKQRFVTDNKALGQAIEGASQTSLPGFLTAWTNVFRALAASRNPAFVAGHASFTIPQYILRQTSIEGGPQALPRVVGALAQGYADVFQGFLQGRSLGEAGPGTQQLLKGGGGQFGALSGSAEDAAKAVRQMGGIDIGKPQQALNLVKDLVTLKPVENLVNRVDYGPRVAAMRLAEARGAHPVQAIMAGRDATIDFNRGGVATKLLSQMIPFLNVGVQGPLQVARTFRDNPKAAIYTVGTLLGAPTLAAEIWNNADPQRAKDYADVPQYIKDQGIVIMLPTEAPVDARGDRHPQFAWINTRNWTPFVAATREAAAAVMGTGTHDWQQAANSMLAGALPVQASNPSDFAQKLALSAPGVQTIAQLSLNKDFYRGSDIVTNRADIGASPTAKFLTPGLQNVADLVAPGAQVRPSGVDFTIRNVGAGTAGAALSGSDALLKAAGYGPAQVPRPTAAGPSETPVAGSVIGRFVRGQTGQSLQTARDVGLSQDTRDLLRQGGVQYQPTPVPSTVQGIPLHQDEETQMQVTANQLANAYITRVAASSAWQRATPDQRQVLVQDAVANAHADAEATVLRTIPRQELLARRAAAPPTRGAQSAAAAAWMNP